MPFALLTIGLLLVVSGFNNTYKQLGSQVASDFSGQGSFIWFMVAIGAVGAIGYIKPLETPSRWMLALIMISLFIGAVNKGGFFNKLTSGINAGDSSSTTVGAPLAGSSSSSSNSSSFSPSEISTLTNALTPQ